MIFLKSRKNPDFPKKSPKDPFQFHNSAFSVTFKTVNIHYDILKIYSYFKSLCVGRKKACFSFQFLIES